jgi:hypothetical protein
MSSKEVGLEYKQTRKHLPPVWINVTELQSGYETYYQDRANATKSEAGLIRRKQKRDGLKDTLPLPLQDFLDEKIRSWKERVQSNLASLVL